jgi:mono/diheme cytochrome c family protein
VAASLRIGAALLGACAWLAACGSEDRAVDREAVRTPPRDAGDGRIPYVQENRFQVARGGRYFAWYGCDGCHREGGDTALNLADGTWRHGGDFSAVFASIAEGRPGMPAYGGRMPVQVLWQVTAYVRDLGRQTPAMRRRQGLDQQPESTGRGS